MRSVLGRVRGRHDFDVRDSFCVLCGNVLDTSPRQLVRRHGDSRGCVCHDCLDVPPIGASTPAPPTAPQRYLRLPDFAMPPHCPGECTFPIGVTLLVRPSPGDRPVACWPTADGPSEVALPPQVWPRLVACSPELARWRPGIEAMLFRRRAQAPGTLQALLLPTDACASFLGSLHRPRSHGDVKSHVAHALAELWARADALARAAGKPSDRR